MKDFCGFDLFDENFESTGDLPTAVGVTSVVLDERQVRQRLAYDEAFWLANLRLHDTHVDTTIPCFLQVDIQTVQDQGTYTPVVNTDFSSTHQNFMMFAIMIF